MKWAEGIVLYVQEGRFVLLLADGAGQTFVLSHRAPIEPQQLQELQRAQARIRVGFTDGEQSMWAVVHAVQAASLQVAENAERV